VFFFSHGLSRIETQRTAALAAVLLLAMLPGLATNRALAQAATATATQAIAQTTSAASGTIRGHIVDPSGAYIAGAKVVIANAAGVPVASAKADAQGVYAIGNLPVGSYIVQATVEGFAPFGSPTIQLNAGQSKRVDIAMAILAEQQSVVVSDEDSSGVSIDAGSNVSAVVLKDQDLDALSDDPDELQNELTALAGPAAGPNGGQIYIDGFTGGTLPPKSAIREIRINQNPFSAEYDRIGYGRIEILTKPGTDKFHARGFLQGNDDVFNTSNPFAKSIPSYHSIQYNANASGAISKIASFFLSVEGRNTQDANVYTVYQPVYNTASGTYQLPTDSSGNLLATTGGLLNPANRVEISPRLDIQLGAKNTLTTRFQYEHGSSTNNLSGTTSLPSLATNSSTTELQLQASLSTILTDHMVTETRLQLRRDLSTATPANTAPTVSVSGYFGNGGASSQYSSDHSDRIELQNTTTISAGAHAIKFGGVLRDNRQASYSNSGFNGSYSFQSLTNYVQTLNWKLNPSSTTPAVYKLSYSSSPSGQLTYRANTFDAAAFFQDDWKQSRFLTLSFGLRFESQNHISDHADFAPRLAFAYALDGHKKGKQTKTVLRGGYGFFYDRFSNSSLMSLERYSGGANSILQTVISSPQCFDATSLSNVSLSTCGSGSSSTNQVNSLDPTYRSPYSEQLGVSVERQISKTVTLSGTYIHTFGVHQSATINANPYQQSSGSTYYSATSGSRLNTSQGIVDEIFPEAVFKQNQLMLNMNAKLSPKFSVTGFYNMGVANGNTGTASNSYNLRQDYGRSSFQRRNMIFLMGNYTAPWGVSVNPFVVAQSGHPYNIVTQTDQTGDNFMNNRPAYANATSCAATNTTNTGRYVQTNFGCMDVAPTSYSNLVPVNMANGPAAVAVNVRLSRSFGVGPKTAKAAGGNDPQHPQGSYMGGGPGGGGGRGGHGGGGPGGMGGANSTGRKYALNFSASALNLFNNIDYGQPSGIIVPTYNTATSTWGPGSRFGQSTALAGGMFASPSSSAARRIYFQLAFSF